MPDVTTSMLNSLAQILETDGWDSMKEAGAEIEQLYMHGDSMVIDMTNQEGVTKTFMIAEVDFDKIP